MASYSIALLQMIRRLWTFNCMRFNLFFMP